MVPVHSSPLLADPGGEPFQRTGCWGNPLWLPRRWLALKVDRYVPRPSQPPNPACRAGVASHTSRSAQ